MADVITRLKVESTEYDNKIKRAQQGLLNLEQEVRKTGTTFSTLSREQVNYIQSLGRMETSSRNAKGKIGELGAAFTELSLMYKRMTDQEKSSPAGKALAQSLDQLKTRVVQAKADLADLNKSLNETGKEMESAAGGGVDFGAVLSQLGSQLGINSQLMQALSTGTVATTAAIAAGAVAAGAAAKAWSDYNDELVRQNTMTSVVTGGKGGEDLTMGVRALARTYDVDFRQAIEAANTLMQQFGVNSSEALRLLQDGMQGMIAGDGGKLLSMIQQYAPSFRDAGIEASQLVAIIQNSEGGIFTDQNMNAIVMGIKNIRLMTKQTSDALAQLGIDGEEMTRKLNDGSMTIFEAMQQVSTAIENAGSSSQAVGQVMQQVFGRQGTAAGTNLAKAIETLNTNLEVTKTQTGELGESFVKLNEANMRLEETMKEIFGLSGWEDMNNLLKTDLANTLSDILDIIGGIKQAIADLGDYSSWAWTDFLKRMSGEAYKKPTGGGSFTGMGKSIGSSVSGIVSAARTEQQSGFVVVTDGKGNVVKATRGGQDVTAEYKASITPTGTGTTTTKPKGGGGKSGTAWAPIVMGDFGGIGFGRSMKDVQADLSRAQGAYNVAEDESSRAAAKKMVEAYQQELETMKNEGDVTKGGFADAYNHDIGKNIARLEKDRIRNDNENKATTEKTMVGELQKITGGVQGMLSGLNQMGVEIPEGLNSVVSSLSGMLSVLQSINMIVGTIQSIQTVGTFLGIFGHGGIVGKAANGMVVPGNSFSGDNLRMPVAGGGMIGVNSGELILSMSQQNNVASALLSRQQGGAVDVQPWIDGERIFLGMNNTTRRQGKGEIVTTSMLKQKGIL